MRPVFSSFALTVLVGILIFLIFIDIYLNGVGL